jgi:lambda family phage tail tape measure protein
MSDEFSLVEPEGGDMPKSTKKTQDRLTTLGIGTTAFANAIAKAFAQATVGGKQFDEVLKGLALRLDSLAVAAAFKPLARGLAGGFTDLLGTIFGSGTGSSGKPPRSSGGGVLYNLPDGIQPFASGGVIGTPSYFPLASGGLGLAGEAGPEAIMPLTRGPDGSLGVVASGAAAPANVTIHIATPDAESFRRSEAYLTGQIARAVARGQRSL